MTHRWPRSYGPSRYPNISVKAMPRRVSSSQLKNMIRQAEQKRRQAINKYNQAARKYNSAVKRAVDNHNREVRAHNARVRANRQRLRFELNRLAQRSATTTSHHVVEYRSSVQTLHRSYERLEDEVATRDLNPQTERIVDMSEIETANSVAVADSLLSDAQGDGEAGDLGETSVTDELREIDPDLDGRWRGAVFALSPMNPDAARHFCTSAREIFVRILDVTAPDAHVLASDPECPTHDGRPTRRAKVHYLLARKGVGGGALEDFVEEDMTNILQLFRVFNDGTHGGAGRFSIGQLVAIKRRVESGILFLHQIAV